MSLFKENTASNADIMRNFSGCKFEPPLESYVDDIPAYIEKILKHAQRFECWIDDELAGLVAVYCNDFESLAAFITMVSVIEKYTGRGIAKQLMEQAISHCRMLKFKVIKLEVDARNAGAIHVYERYGFQTAETRGNTLLMSLELR